MGGGGASGRGGYSTQRCATTTAHDSANLDRIMVKFRPIAPKPSISGSVSGIENKNWVFTKTRAKRRYTRVNNKSKGRRALSDEKNSESDRSENGVVDMITLSLLPETPGGQKVTPARSPPSSSDHDLTKQSRLIRSDLTAMMMQEQQQQREITMSSRSAEGGSIVTVECVEAVGSNYVERMIDLKNNTCPGFISDGYNRVWWTNEAFRMMVGLDSNMVWLVMKVRLPLMGWSFVCRVRLQYTWKNEKKSMVVPCDVWKMDSGDFAWSLDVQAALSLGK
ncbi:von willebrand factor A domain protein [Thalictrum thalictroides]|uniref:von willebrand factor A domain protein n=1 Tax=Thalictrum thalictroides TaxID=46969 RepID=A0A7J6VUB5_THATH|nr:von willebrand factor A domain protein [Thalictrum thalictroides]